MPGMEPRPVPDFPGYRVHTDGTVETCKKWQGRGRGRKPVFVLTDDWRPLGVDTDERGRKRVTLSRDGRARKFRVSVLVLTAFVGPCPDGLECCHENGDETDDRLGNLRWDTHSSNLMDRRRHGTVALGSKHFRAKLTEEAVLEIRRAGPPYRRHAEKFGVTETLVSMVYRRKIWTHL